MLLSVHQISDLAVSDWYLNWIDDEQQHIEDNNNILIKVT